mmetsp:Transcript_14151/g.38446  ORF Transcript_14151/g.38446 Transcript_14151/m.38446 type:complete len:260 (-) Transcript_14151:2-781(-)
MRCFARPRTMPPTSAVALRSASCIASCGRAPPSYRSLGAKSDGWSCFRAVACLKSRGGDCLEMHLSVRWFISAGSSRRRALVVAAVAGPAPLCLHVLRNSLLRLPQMYGQRQLLRQLQRRRLLLHRILLRASLLQLRLPQRLQQRLHSEVKAPEMTQSADVPRSPSRATRWRCGLISAGQLLQLQLRVVRACGPTTWSSTSTPTACGGDCGPAVGRARMRRSLLLRAAGWRRICLARWIQPLPRPSGCGHAARRGRRCF